MTLAPPDPDRPPPSAGLPGGGPAKARGEGGWWRWIVAGSISLGLLGGLLALAGPGELVEALAGARGGPLWVAAGLFAVTTACRWLRVLIVVPPEARRPLPLLGVTAGHAFLNKIMPVRTGELAFPLLLRRATGASLTTGLLTLALLRVVEVACLAPIYATALALWGVEVGAAIPTGPWLIPIALGVAGATLAALPSLLRRGVSLGDRLLSRPSLRGSERAARIRRGLGESAGEVARVGVGGMVMLSATTMVMWMSLFGVFHACVLALSIDIPFAQTIVGSGGGVLTNLLPINGIGSFGTLEVGWTAGFAATGEAISPVLAAGVVMHALVLVLTGVFALVGAFGLRGGASGDAGEGADQEVGQGGDGG